VTFPRLGTIVVTLLVSAGAAIAQQPRPYTAAIVIDPATRQVLYDYNSREPLPIASMTKMMTLLVVLDEIEKGNITWETPVETSAEASRMGGSQVYLRHREVFSVREMVAAVMVHSANDAALALAEKVSGNRDGFIRLMNQKAGELGLKGTSFHTPHGLPARGDDKDDTSTAYDLALTGIELMKHDEMQKLAVTQTMPFRNGEFIMYNPNHLIRNYPAATGIKTGFHNKAGFCVTASARRDNMDLVAVVMGSQRKQDNFSSAARLFDIAFRQFSRIEPVQAGQRLDEEARITEGKRATVPVVAGSTLPITVNNEKKPKIEVAVHSTSPAAPIRKGDRVGWIIVKQNGRPVARVPALAAEDVERASWVRRLWPS
jgi:serine-type D-Ala-D-Ala carboxypeptidase (penicillin-binding protein 5/6)